MLCSYIPCGLDWKGRTYGFSQATVRTSQLPLSDLWAALLCHLFVTVAMALLKLGCICLESVTFFVVSLTSRKKEKTVPPLCERMGLSDSAIGPTLSSWGEYQFTRSHLGFCLTRALCQSNARTQPPTHPRTHMHTILNCVSQPVCSQHEA